MQVSRTAFKVRSGPAEGQLAPFLFHELNDLLIGHGFAGVAPLRARQRGWELEPHYFASDYGRRLHAQNITRAWGKGKPNPVPLKPRTLSWSAVIAGARIVRLAAASRQVPAFAQQPLGGEAADNRAQEPGVQAQRFALDLLPLGLLELRFDPLHQAGAERKQLWQAKQSDVGPRRAAPQTMKRTQGRAELLLRPLLGRHGSAALPPPVIFELGGN